MTNGCFQPFTADTQMLEDHANLAAECPDIGRGWTICRVAERELPICEAHGARVE